MWKWDGIGMFCTQLYLSASYFAASQYFISQTWKMLLHVVYQMAIYALDATSGEVFFSRVLKPLVSA